jgi:hypothetical protein
MRMPNKKGNRGRPIVLRCLALRTVADHVQTASQAHAAETKICGNGVDIRRLTKLLTGQRWTRLHINSWKGVQRAAWSV